MLAIGKWGPATGDSIAGALGDSFRGGILRVAKESRPHALLAHRVVELLLSWALAPFHGALLLLVSITSRKTRCATSA